MSYLQCTPAMIQVPCTGGTTTHILEAVGTERLAFKVKLKQRYYDLYKVSPPLGFIKPGVKKELFLRRLPGKPGKTKLVLEYIASPEGYDPRKPFVEGADVGVLMLRVRAYVDKKLPDDVPTIMGKVVTKIGQKFTPSPGYDDRKLETEIEELYKDKEKAGPVERIISKKKIGKEKVVKGKAEGVSLSKEKLEKEKGIKGKAEGVSLSKEKLEKEGKEEEEESVSSSEEDEMKDGKGKKKGGKKEGIPIQVIMPDFWKDFNVSEMKKSNDELKAALQAITNENKRLEEIIIQMMKEITFLREALLSTVLKLVSAGPGSGQALSTTLTAAGTPVAGKSGTDITVGGGTQTSSTIKSIAKSASPAVGAISTTTTPAASGTGGAKAAAVAQSGAGGAGKVAQTGASRMSTVTQTGAGGAGKVAQTGASRMSTVTQTGAGGAGKVAQTGASRMSTVTQTGAGGAGKVAQTGASRMSTVTQTGAGGAGKAAQAGTGGVGTVAQAGATGAITLTQTGAGAEVENYLSAMLAESGPTGGAKESDGAALTSAMGGVKEFSLYFAAGGAGTRSTYVVPTTTKKTTDLKLAFGSTADQLGKGGRRDSSDGSTGGSGSTGGGAAVSDGGGGGAGGGYRGVTSVYF